MTVLNLDKTFTPFGPGIEFEKFMFPSKCEQHIKLPKTIVDIEATITCRIQSSDDIMLLLLATDALKRGGAKNIKLFIPYLPFARQDRQMVKGEPLSLKVFTDLINAQGYSKVGIFDVHSDVAPALINNCEAYDNHNFVSNILNRHLNYYIISPDAGAYKKIFKVAQHINYKDEIIMCNKLRDVSNGVIRSITVSHDDLKGKDCFIIDDICDGGGTFLLLAQQLRERNCGNVYLIVSHGIFSGGLDAFHDINHVFTTDSFKDHPEHKKLTELKLATLLIS